MERIQLKRTISLIAVLAMMGAMTIHAFAEDWREKCVWSVPGVEYCVNNAILSGDRGDLMLERKVTRSQAAKMAAVAFGLQNTGSNSFQDTDSSLWDYPYINAIEAYLPNKSAFFRGEDSITREEFAALIGSILGYSADYDNSLHSVFSDAAKIDYSYRGYVAKTVAAGILTGANGNFRPKAYLTRAEACTVIQRAVNVSGRSGSQETVQPTVQPTAQPQQRNEQFTASTNILGEAQISVEQAQKWARSKGATDKFINIAPTYWYYGGLTGIRPEVLYAQAALETGYGHYTGVVSEDMNNWAGIKVKGRNDDAKDAHESFATPEEGARAHFNHMAAYVGVEPVGTPHGRYYSVKSLDWAGTVRTLEELSGKWCPDPEYAKKILEGCLIPMSNF